MEKETNEQTIQEYFALLKMFKSKRNLLRKLDIDSYSEFLIEQRLKKFMEKMETVRLNRQQIHSESKNKFSFLVFFIVQTRKWDFQADRIILSHVWYFSIIFSFKFFTG